MKRNLLPVILVIAYTLSIGSGLILCNEGYNSYLQKIHMETKETVNIPEEIEPIDHELL